MRALFILTKRQLIDGVPYFVAATVIGVILPLVTLIAAFKCSVFDLLNAPFHTTAMFIPLPFLIALGLCARGIAQTYTDRTKGISETLAVLPTTRAQIALSHIINGTILVMIVLIPVAITLVALCVLRRPLIPPFWQLASNAFLGIFLMALACYCLGLQMGHTTDTFMLALGALPLAATLLLLILVEGFGNRLNVILLLFITASLLRSVKASAGNLTTRIATGFMVLVLLAISLFWGRLLCDLLLASHIPEETRLVKIRPSGLAPQIENDPNVAEPSFITARFSKPTAKEFLLSDNSFSHIWDIINPFYDERRGPYTNIYKYGGSSEEYLYFDKGRGLFVCRARMRRLPGQKSTGNGSVEFYAGPKGISRTPQMNLGRFSWPIAQHEYSMSIVGYDRQSRRFFAMDFETGTVEQGSELKNPADHPVEIGSWIHSTGCSVGWTPPHKRLQYPHPEEEDRLMTWTRPLISNYEHSRRDAGNFVLVLDRSGRIDLLDRKTLKLVRPAGYLPPTQTIWGEARTPANLRAYEIRPLSIGRPRVYAGMVVGSLSSRGTSMAVSVFDKEGNKVKAVRTKSDFFDVPWGPALALIKYVFESLHPPALTLVSFFTAYSFEARSAHRAIFLMPNSFAAMVRDREGNILVTLGILVLVMLLGLALAGWLGYRVTRDAGTIGLSLGARRFWLGATVAFGLAGYITYRLSRPKVTLITCTNCGKGRRPDTETCHHCGQKWDVSELAPPAWRVSGERPERDRQGCTEMS